MKRLYVMLLMIFVVNAFGVNAGKNIITKDLKAVLKQKNENDLIRVNIRLKEQMNQMNRYSQLQRMDMEQRRNEVVNDLKSIHKQSQSSIMSFLSEKPSSSFKLIHQLWIANVITAFVDKITIYELAQRTDIDRIDIDEKRRLVDVVLPKPEPIIPGAKDINEITYNVLKVNADDVWALGYTGEGVIVSVIDAGINYNHVDLADHMWEDADYPNHGYDFYNNDNDPMDGHGHGTHCAGTVAGDGTAGSQTGMAPDATLMACKVLADNGDGQESDVWAAIEFSVEHGANVISMSLGWMHSWNPDRQTWRLTYDNALAAGVIASVAAGNEGGSVTNPDDVRTPGDCPPPWLNPEQTLEGGISAVFCVGATDANDDIAYFSSRGPSDWSDIDPFFDYPFNPEMGLLRPDVSAPGVDVKSCDAFNPNGYTIMSGTSMATPAVAGVMALILSKNPGLSPAEIAEVLETNSVDLGDEGKDNVFGSGRIDAFQAVENTSEQGPVYDEHVFVDPNGNGNLEAGESVLMTMTMFNGSDMEFSNVDVTVTSPSSYIVMTDSTENYGDFGTGEAVTVEDAFALDVAENMPGQMNIRFNVFATDGTESWESNFDVISYGPNISIGSLMIDDANGNSNGRLDPGEEVALMVEVINTGQVSIEDLNLELDYNGDYLNFETTIDEIPELGADDSEFVAFNVMVSPDANVGQSDMFTANLNGGVFSDSKDFLVVIGLILEDWETGDFTSFQWGFGGGDWFITDQYPYEGEYCAQSADIGDGQQTSMVIDYEVGTEGTLSFYKKVSSESTFDYLRFFIDGVEQDSWSGEIDWSMEEYTLSEGLHTLKWEYDKDGSVSSGSDAAWVDYIIFPPMALPEIVMEQQAEICEDQTYTSDAVVENYESLLWTTNGDGTFDDETIAMSVYTPGNEDIANGIVDLKLTATGSNGDVNKVLALSVFSNSIDAPEVPTGETVLCINPAQQTYVANLMDGYELSWTLDPFEAGELMANADSVVVIWSEEFTGSAILSVKNVSICAESVYSEPLEIEVYSLPTLAMETEMEACYGQEFNLVGDLSGSAPWTINIEGYGDLNIETSPLEMNWLAMNDTSLTVNWIQDANSCLNEESISLSIDVNESPMILLEDSTLCMNHEIVLDAGNSGASFDWSTGESTQTITVDSSGLDANQEKEISVWVTNEFDCTTEKSVTITFQDCSGIEEIGLTNWRLYPNPSNGYVDLELNSNNNQEMLIEIHNIQGQLIYDETIHLEYGSNKHQLDLNSLVPQTYFILLKNNQGQIIKRLIIE